MNFYIGTAVDALDLSAKSIELSDDILQYIVENEEKIQIDLSSLVEIDPYADEIIHHC